VRFGLGRFGLGRRCSSIETVRVAFSSRIVDIVVGQLLLLLGLIHCLQQKTT
jgi:hypothetical protein